MYTAIIIADEVLRLAKKKGKSLTPLQLMKLVYISHGWSLGIRDIDLFNDRIEAWKYGPVIPSLYQATKKFGRSEIPLDLVDIEGASHVDESTQKFLADVYSKYGDLTGVQLSGLTHQLGTPWDQVYDKGIFGIEIPDNIIADHYKRLLDERSVSSAAA
jgi:uncharacterized phage-associated protein